MGCPSCLGGIRACFNSLYCRINPSAAASSPLTNHPFKESCQISAVTFAYQNHKFFNLGGTLTILLTLFNCLIWVILCYIIIYSSVYSTTTPPPITSMGMPMLCVFLCSLVTGSMLANMYTTSLDCLIFCFILEKRNNVQNPNNEVKDAL